MTIGAERHVAKLRHCVITRWNLTNRAGRSTDQVANGLWHMRCDNVGAKVLELSQACGNVDHGLEF